MGFVFGFILGVAASVAVYYFYPKLVDKYGKKDGTTGPTGTSY